ncbi:uncharacterized protein G2W53_018347 [Senna tora]|uniref:Uncharacterized protein n=1 Tax=Senna tora TaxID=362788 RepID=A0A834TRV4_9FABA|nr:uncharacterized protein G2W53_018347 [Senna tora]
MESRLQANLASRKMRDLLEESVQNEGEEGINQKEGDEGMDNPLTDLQAIGTEDDILVNEPENLHRSWADEVEAQDRETTKTKNFYLKARINYQIKSKSPTYPSIQLSPEEIRQAHAYWAFSIIVHLIGCWIDQPSLSNKLCLTWKLKTEPNLLNIGSGFFIVRFGCVEDR